MHIQISSDAHIKLEKRFHDDQPVLVLNIKSEEGESTIITVPLEQSHIIKMISGLVSLKEIT